MVATLEKFLTRMQAGDLNGALEMVDEDAVWQEAETLPWSGEWRGPDGFARLVGAIDTSTELTTQDYVLIEAGEVVELRLKRRVHLPQERAPTADEGCGALHGA